MKKNQILISVLLIVVAAFGSAYLIKENEKTLKFLNINIATQKPDQYGVHIMMTPQEMKFADGPESLPPGAKISIVEGDLASSGPFILRLKMPVNYVVSPHTHPSIEHVTVLEGDLYFGIGEKFDKSKAKKMPAGSVIVMPKEHKHFAFSKDKPVTVQLHGIGPWGITYVNPSDDPRNKAMK